MVESKKHIVEIVPTGMYRPSYLENILGKRCVRTLREAGLRVVGGWYLGEIVIDSFKRAWQIKACQRVPEGKEGDK